MIRIIFDNGEVADCEHIEKVYVEEYEMNKVTIVGKMEDEMDDLQTNDQGTGGSERKNKTKTSDD